MVLCLDLRLVHGVGDEVLEDVALVVLKALGAHAVDDDVVVGVVHVLARVVLKERKVYSFNRCVDQTVNILNVQAKQGRRVLVAGLANV